ncbi:MAG: hypothetical protein ACLVKO_08980 [Dysgonomonas sp.]
MKKLLLLLLFVPFAFTACDSDDDGILGGGGGGQVFNPVEGKWSSKAGDNRIVRNFTKDFHSYIYVYYKGQFVERQGEGLYRIDNEKIYMESKTVSYSFMNADSLYLTIDGQKTLFERTDEALPPVN